MTDARNRAYNGDSNALELSRIEAKKKSLTKKSDHRPKATEKESTKRIRKKGSKGTKKYMGGEGFSSEKNKATTSSGGATREKGHPKKLSKGKGKSKRSWC